MNLRTINAMYGVAISLSLSLSLSLSYFMLCVRVRVRARVCVCVARALSLCHPRLFSRWQRCVVPMGHTAFERSGGRQWLAQRKCSSIRVCAALASFAPCIPWVGGILHRYVLACDCCTSDCILVVVVSVVVVAVVVCFGWTWLTGVPAHMDGPATV